MLSEERKGNHPHELSALVTGFFCEKLVFYVN